MPGLNGGRAYGAGRLYRDLILVEHQKSWPASTT
jgi:hypothetical protein